MAAVFDINHKLHSLSAMIGIPSLSVAAMLISITLVRTEPWSIARSSLLWTANLTWVSILLMAVTFGIMMATYAQAGGDMSANAQVVTSLPEGVIAFGLGNRFDRCLLCMKTAAWQASGKRVNTIP
jgi:hypothetical protein